MVRIIGGGDSFGDGDGFGQHHSLVLLPQLAKMIANAAQEGSPVFTLGRLEVMLLLVV